MKLLYELNERDLSAFREASGGEAIYYCIPFNILDARYVDGYIAVTKTAIYKLCGGELIAKYPLKGAHTFTAESLYASGGFYGVIDGHPTLIAQFITGRHLSRYMILCRACEILAENGGGERIENHDRESFCEKCGRPYVAHTTICPFCLDKKDVYKKLWALTKGLRFMMFSPFIFTFLNLIINFFLPYLQKIAIDSYFKPEEVDFIATLKEKQELILLTAAMVGLILLARGISVLQSRLLAVAAGKFSVIMKTLLYEKIQMLSMGSVQKRSTGDLMGRVTNDTNIVKDFIVQQFPNIFIQVVSLFAAAVVLLFINPVMALFIIVPVPFVIYLIRVFWSMIQRRNVKAWMAGSRQNRLLQDILNGIRVVKSFGQEDLEISRYKKANMDHTSLVISNQKIFDTMFPILTFLVEAGRYLILFYGSFLVLDKVMQFGELQYFNTMAAYIYAPLIWMTNIPRTFSQFLTSAGKIFEILEENLEVDDIALPIDIRIEGDISVRNITFGYESYDPVLKNVSLELRHGETLGIVGHSGCGKTTLINLIMRLYDVNEGGIYIDEVNIKDISQAALRSQIGVVLQENFLFSGTIRDNIKYARPHATDEEVIEAARTANAHDFIVSLPEGYNTIVGEKGYSLSGGERQRIAIARALLHNPRILILDEATAALDTETEKLVQDALQKLSSNRTTIAIAHRLSTLRNADKLLVLDKGRVAECGTHQQLLARKGLYYKLVMAQRQMAHRIVNR